MRSIVARALAGALPLALFLPAAAEPVHAAPPAAKPAVFRVGAAVEAIGPDPGVPLYSGGFGSSPPITSEYAPLQVRAIYVSNGGHAVAMAVVDSQAWFAAYQEGPTYGITYAREQAAAAISRLGHPAMTRSDIIVQGTHSHSAPTAEGIWGPVPPSYLRKVTDQTIAALTAAAADAHPALLQWGSVQAPDLDNVITAQTDSYAGWTQDGQVSVLRAVDPDSGATLATFANVPAHPDIVNGAGIKQLGADYFGDVRDSLQRLLGGTVVVGPATLGREETFVQVGGLDQMHWFAQVVTNRITEALATAQWITDPRISAAEVPVAVPGTNPLLLALVAANHLPADQQQQLFQQTGEYPIDRADTPPYLTGTVIGTYLTALRVGTVAYVSMPGEAFPEIRNAIVQSTSGAAMIVGLNKGQDDWGYYYPAWVTPFTEVYHSDHLEYNVSPTAGDQIIEEQLLNLQSLGFATTPGVGTPMNTDWQQLLKPGVQALAAPGSGDVGADGGFTTTLQAAFSEAAYNGAALKGLVHWSFGDGGTAETHAVRDGSGASGAQMRFQHTFTVGHWTVRLNAVDTAGNATSWQLPVTVYPALQPAVAAQLGHGVYDFTASATGGDGALLAAHWTFSDGTSADGLRVSHAFPAGVTPGATMTAVDGTDSTATASWPVAGAAAPQTAALHGWVNDVVPGHAGVTATGGTGRLHPVRAIAVSAIPASRAVAGTGLVTSGGVRAPLAVGLVAAGLLLRRLVRRRRRGIAA